jgi:competence protein ComEA
MNLRRAVPALAVALAFAVLPSLALAAKAAPAGKVNVNTASVEQLATLPGVGPKLAARIVEYRQKTPFKALPEVMNVKGIGEKNFEKLQPFLSLGDAARAGAGK